MKSGHVSSSSSMKDDLRYTPSDCFETFPFPENFETNPALEAVGQAYYEFRAALMVRNNEGLTKTYNRFHDPDERSPDILKLRELHAAMDRAVLDAYGWTDLQPTCEFLLDYEEDEDEDETGGGRRRKKPWRYRWPDDFRDEVLARLLELNRQRAEQERLSGAADEASEEAAEVDEAVDLTRAKLASSDLSPPPATHGRPPRGPLASFRQDRRRPRSGTPAETECSRRAPLLASFRNAGCRALRRPGLASFRTRECRPKRGPRGVGFVSQPKGPRDNRVYFETFPSAPVGISVHS